MTALHQPTFGEKHLYGLLRQLPKKQFFFRWEPELHTEAGSSKPDFVVVSALHGVLVVEVKDWVKLLGGDQHTLQTERRGGQPAAYDNPVRQAERYAYDLKRRFEARAELWEQYRGRTVLKFPWQVLVALPRIPQKVVAQFEQKGIWPRGVVLGREKLASAAHLQQAIHDLPWKFPLERPLSLDMLDMIREILDPSLAVQNDDGLPVGTLTLLQAVLVEEPLRTRYPTQLPLFEYEPLSEETQEATTAHSVRLVRGVAGSGKTLVLVRRAQRLAAANPQARLLVMTFNVEMTRDLAARLRLPAEQAEVASFHRICRRIIGPAWREPIKTGDWLREHARADLDALGLSPAALEEEFAWRKELRLLDDAAYLEAERHGRGFRLDRARRERVNAVFARYRAHQAALRAQGLPWADWHDISFIARAALENPAPHPLLAVYDAVLIDEAQDFAPSWLVVAQRLLKPGGSLLLCDDPSQSIFRAYSWAQKGVDVVGRSRILRVPFRSTREISQAAHSLIEADEGLRGAEDRAEPDFSSYELSSGPLPALLACPDSAAEAAMIESRIEALLAQGLTPGQVAILCHGKWQTPRWETWRERGVYVMHFDKIKGLEFAAVFLPHLHDAFPRPEDSEAVTAARRRLFTAMTRARYRLVMSYCGRLPTPLEPLLPHAWCEAVQASPP